MKMSSLRCTLVSDGSSDVVLAKPIKWLLEEIGVSREIEIRWPDLRAYPTKKRRTLADKIDLALTFYPCDLLLLHRDAERDPRERRACEIHRAAEQALRHHPSPPFVCVVPVRMQEVWILIDEMAIRLAANNPKGGQRLRMPAIQRLESLPDPKNALHRLILEATELSKRRREKFKVAKATHRVAEHIEDFSHLRELSAFAALENDLRLVVKLAGWA